MTKMGPGGTARVVSPPKRLNVNLPESARAEVDQLAASSGLSITELVRLGLSMVKVIITESNRGHKLVIVTGEGAPVKELIIPGIS